MTDLYSLRSTGNPAVFRVTKFTPDLDAVSSYLIGPDGCECPGYSGRGFCRHSQIVAAIQAADRADSGWFLETDAKGNATGWRQYVGPFDAEAPGHTDLMISPEAIDIATSELDDLDIRDLPDGAEKDHHLASELDPAPAPILFTGDDAIFNLPQHKGVPVRHVDHISESSEIAPSDLSHLRSRLR